MRSRYYIDDEIPIVKYGNLYNWPCTQGTGDYSLISLAMANEGWRIPSWYDCNDLGIYVGGSSIAGGELKEHGTTYWTADNGTNDYNFNWRGGGIRQGIGGSFLKLQLESFIWTTEIQNANASYVYNAVSGQVYAYLIATFNSNGCSIRLVRPATTPEQSQGDGSACAPYIGNDGLSYPTTKIGPHVWLACNLAETKLRNGTLISVITDNAQWASQTGKAMCYYNNAFINVFI